MLKTTVAWDSGQVNGWINFTKNQVFVISKDAPIWHFFYTGENSNFTLENPRRHHLNQAIKVDNASNEINEPSTTPDKTKLRGILEKFLNIKKYEIYKRQRLRNYFRLKDTKEIKTQCNTSSQVTFWITNFLIFFLKRTLCAQLAKSEWGLFIRLIVLCHCNLLILVSTMKLYRRISLYLGNKHSKISRHSGRQIC